MPNIIIFIISSMIIFIAGAWLLKKSLEDWESFIAFVLAIVTLVMGGIMLLGSTLTCWSWFASEHQAKLINQEFGTNYTREEVFWASDVIEEIRELKRQRIEVNGNIMGHGKQIPKEE